MLLNENLSTKYAIPLYELLVREANCSQTIPTVVISLGCSPQLDGETLLVRTQDSVAGRESQARGLLSSFLFSYPAVPRQLLFHSPWPSTVLRPL